jgi:hypothetical protein
MQGARSTLCLFFLLGGCGGEDAPSDRHDINGSVNDARSNAPISQAVVTFESDALDHAETTSDGAGHFTLQVDVREGVDFGTVRASRDGYEPSVAQSVYFDAQAHVLSLKLTAKESASQNAR